MDNVYYHYRKNFLRIHFDLGIGNMAVFFRDLDLFFLILWIGSLAIALFFVKRRETLRLFWLRRCRLADAEKIAV